VAIGDANSAFHLMTIVRLRSGERTPAYAARRTMAARSARAIVRGLKRYVAREVYRTLCADPANLATATAA
jgi:transposase